MKRSLVNKGAYQSWHERCVHGFIKALHSRWINDRREILVEWFDPEGNSMGKTGTNRPIDDGAWNTGTRQTSVDPTNSQAQIVESEHLDNRKDDVNEILDSGT